ncbi:MAG: Translation elongation factor Ts [uncultured Gemmatimonadaceae bacterium]|uniref:Elongation factor Ts n=1 Tax=uncultured Gemmatimonadaceae bacterium TaxID=246130 RepID=A0A6J4KI71_9BACT|nr:MAG: Translation elongation factor Ts [uncultured Gemmatimonadaceae bacterium]
MAATFTAKDVSELRQRTGAGMMDCKKALEETGGNIEQAIDYLRKKGIAKAEKRVGRTASEGRIVSLTSPDGRHAVLLELNSETDFVSRNDAFVKLAEDLAHHAMRDEATNAVVHNGHESPMLHQPWHGGGGTVNEVMKEASGRTGENIVLRRYARFAADGALGSYVHHNGKVAALVELGGSTGPEASELARTIAEHVAAGVPTIPVAVSREDVSPELVEKERRIFAEQAKASGKPDNIVEKMVGGRIDKYYKEVALLEQPWVRDDSKTIRDLLAEAGKRAGAPLTVKRFARFQMGEE